MAAPRAAGFPELGLSPLLCSAVKRAGYTEPTPIQRRAIPQILRGKDLLGCARTGTGKTAAFALPLLHLMMDEAQRRGVGKGGRKGGADQRRIRTLVLAPTRELAAQIHEMFEKYADKTDLRSVVVFGGVGKQQQINALGRGVDILVATPGRLIDLHNEGRFDLRDVEHYVLDEADRMLDMGFIHDVRRITSLIPTERQTLMFSATMPKEIRQLAQSLLYEPAQVAVDPVSSTCKPVKQGVYFVAKEDKLDLLIHLLGSPELKRVLVFARTKHGADKLAKKLVRAGFEASAIHGNKSQGAREQALAGIKSGEVRIVVATDIAARGIDVKGLTHVINYELPNIPEGYVHRIGRTGRAGAAGVAVAFCAPEEKPFLRDIEKLTKRKLDRLRSPLAGAGAAGGRDAALAGRRSERSGRPAPPPPRGSGRPSGAARPEPGRPGSGRPASGRPEARRPGTRRPGPPRPGAPRRGGSRR